MAGLHPAREGAEPSRRTTFTRHSSISRTPRCQRGWAGASPACRSLPLKHRKRCAPLVWAGAGCKSWRWLQFFVPVVQQTERKVADLEAAGAIPAGDSFCRVVQQVGLRILDPAMMVRTHLRQPILEDEPDQRAGTALKADRTGNGLGSMPSVFRHLPA